MQDRRPNDESPEYRRRIRDAIDACRPAREGEDIEDLNQPEIEFLAAHLEAHPEDRHKLDRVQKFDRQIRAQLADISVPDDLAGRLLQELDQAAESTQPQMGGDAFDEAVADDGLNGGDLRPSTREKRTFGWNLWIGIAVAATIAVVATNWFRPVPPLLKNDVHQATLDWFDQHKGVQPAKIDQESMKARYQKFRLSDRVIGATKGAPLNDFLGRGGVVYSLTSPRGLKAKLFVVKIGPARPNSDIPIGRPGNTPYGTQGLSLLVWRENDLLYVLIVPDDPTNHEPYKQFLEGDMPIAWIHASIMRLADV